MEGRFEKRPPHDEVQQELEIVREMAAEGARERAQQTAELAKATEQRDREAAMEALASIEAPSPESSRPDLYGDFAGSVDTEGRIVLPPESRKAMEKSVADFRQEAKLMANLGKGERIAAAYETKARNFRVQTKLDRLPDGKSVYILNDYGGAWVHRTLDGLMKKLNGIPMRKVGRGELKGRHAAMSAIPQIENGDPTMIVMPAIPNANAKDVFAHNKDIKDFGACGWAEEAGLEEKSALAGKIMEEMRRFHGTEAGARGWGEATLSNVIFTEGQEPVMCDFEVKYDEKTPSTEARARDVKDMCMSVSAALEAAHGQDPAATVKDLLDRYGDTEVIAEMKKLASERRGFLKSLVFGYEQARTGVTGKKQYDAVRAAIVAYEATEAS